jgi:hypothetical protein
MTKDVLVPEFIEDKPANDPENGVVELAKVIADNVCGVLAKAPDNASEMVESIEVGCIPVVTYKVIVKLNLR